MKIKSIFFYVLSTNIQMPSSSSFATIIMNNNHILCKTTGSYAAVFLLWNSWLLEGLLDDQSICESYQLKTVILSLRKKWLNLILRRNIQITIGIELRQKKMSIINFLTDSCSNFIEPNCRWSGEINDY